MTFYFFSALISYSTEPLTAALTLGAISERRVADEKLTFDPGQNSIWVKDLGGISFQWDLSSVGYINRLE